MNLDNHIEVTCQEGLIDKNEFLKIFSRVSENNLLDIQDFERLLAIDFPIDLELKKLRKAENITDVVKLVNDNEIVEADFIAIILSNMFYDGVVKRHPLKSCDE
ncbi:hypothetical protein [Chryseobacterium sp.]|uniref:hypothetical protein n=1 Tax=Chryseobacterium sp. TaxID=1871047 RepID=UPI0024E223BA|nr:hypothetical protein [Chryseobacterium sp.]